MEPSRVANRQSPDENEAMPGEWTREHDDTEESIHELRDGKDFIGETRNLIYNKARTPSRESFLKERAPPNQRLVQAFGIDNAFTTADTDRHKAFKAAATKKITIENQEWTGPRDTAKSFGKARIASLKPTKELYLAKLVQFVTLKLSLSFLFQPSEDALGTDQATDDIMFISQEINRLWEASKGDKFSEEWKSQTALHDACRRVTSGSSDSLDPLIPRENPLNFVLPFYETLWRITLRLVLEIRFHGTPAEEADAWRQSLRQYAENPCKDTMRAKNPVSKVSVHDLVREGLRLYPPTRRIYRQRADESGNGIAKADIERCHRNILVAREGPETFRPLRWGSFSDVKDTQKAEEAVGFFPFGHGTYACPAAAARNSFAFRIIALVTWVISEECIGDEWILDGESQLEEPGEAFGSERGDFMELKLVLKEEKVAPEKAGKDTVE